MILSHDSAFAALANPVRRQMLDELLGGSKTVRELGSGHDLTPGAISQHLKVLEEAQLIKRVVKGREHHCELSPAGLDPALEWVERHRAFWRQKLRSFGAHIDKGSGGETNG
ncbi:ArsR/SmtB family transcription factor [Hoeflea prorocentri]|uniref:Metalloregulator ArsR/SmtB family transcription factor n=1 Tax=Hoeflea prorocentri TaxID=1922333 RepID=A0A9X3ZGR3_9HYPH|nr:metalloregulator ArsR/SmtB family transcription factor [Hoeflea prorocentri]MCY6380071.1 metalloregulator ArsR/SmtB family transcription factor [Hoeflea prorocentri]MDA5397871.1 metalloregulator ArsR/SmtB family transcription factor [Hoeflea prorocentri]